MVRGDIATHFDKVCGLAQAEKTRNGSCPRHAGGARTGGRQPERALSLAAIQGNEKWYDRR